MQKNFFPDRIATLCSIVVAAAVLTVGVGGCDFFSGDNQENATPVAATIEPIEGMKYYVGGPVMQADQYGRMRIKSFNGEVKKPTSRGLVIGFKDMGDKRFELRTWLNGTPVTKQFGFIDEQGLFWYDERSTLNSDGVVIVTETLTYDGEAEIMHSKVDYFDPADGEIVKSYEADVPYAPGLDDDDEDDDDEDEDDDADDDATETQ